MTAMVQLMEITSIKGKKICFFIEISSMKKTLFFDAAGKSGTVRSYDRTVPLLPVAGPTTFFGNQNSLIEREKTRKKRHFLSRVISPLSLLFLLLREVVSEQYISFFPPHSVHSW